MLDGEYRTWDAAEVAFALQVNVECEDPTFLRIVEVCPAHPDTISGQCPVCNFGSGDEVQ
jgi:hypothetical protein